VAQDVELVGGLLDVDQEDAGRLDQLHVDEPVVHLKNPRKVL
jgi:hypothetical protein